MLSFCLFTRAHKHMDAHTHTQTHAQRVAMKTCRVLQQLICGLSFFPFGLTMIKVNWMLNMLPVCVTHIHTPQTHWYRMQSNVEKRKKNENYNARPQYLAETGVRSIQGECILSLPYYMYNIYPKIQRLWGQYIGWGMSFELARSSSESRVQIAILLSPNKLSTRLVHTFYSANFNINSNIMLILFLINLKITKFTFAVALSALGSSSPPPLMAQLYTYMEQQFSICTYVYIGRRFTSRG